MRTLTANCPDHGETFSVSQVEPDFSTSPLWFWMNCGDYYSVRFAMFKTAEQLMGPKEWKRYQQEASPCK